MSGIKTHDGTNGNGLFDVLGVAFNAIAALNTARGSSVPAAAVAILAQFAKVAPTTANADVAQGLGDAITSWQSGGSSLTGQIAATCQNLLTSFVQADAGAGSVNPADLTANLQYLIDQMQANGTTGGSYVAANTPGSSGTPVPGGNAGDLAVVMDTVQGDGTAAQNALAETIAFTITSTAATTAPGIVANSPAAQSDRLDYAWPQGSGLANAGIYLTDPADSLLSNGQFETDTIANLPDDWIPYTGVPGTSILVTSPYTQTLTLSGTPTAGSYVLTWSDGTNTHATVPLPYNATASQVQTALQAIPQLSQVTVEQAGSVYDVTFNGIGGAVAEFGVVDLISGGSITPAAPSGGDSLSYSGQSLVFAANGGEQTTLYQALPTLAPDTVYFLHFRLLQDGMTTGTAAATVTASIVAGIGGSPVTDAQGNHNTAQVTVSGTGAVTADQWHGYHMSFRLAPGTAQPVYLKLTTSGLPSGGKVYFDDFAVVQGQQLYNGGPFVAAFKGRTPSAVSDAWSYAVSNTWSNTGGTAGFQTYFNQVFGMADVGLLLPTSVAGGTLIADSLIT